MARTDRGLASGIRAFMTATIERMAAAAMEEPAIAEPPPPPPPEAKREPATRRQLQFDRKVGWYLPSSLTIEQASSTEPSDELIRRMQLQRDRDMALPAVPALRAMPGRPLVRRVFWK